MINPDSPPNEERPASSPQTRSAAQQVVYWLLLVSLLVAVFVMGAWWIASTIPITASTSSILMFAIGGLWMTVYQLLILAIKGLVRSRIAHSKTERA